MDFPKYPRTLHLQGSKGILDVESVPLSMILKNNLIIEEKVDGSCVAIAFNHSKPILKHRNQEICGEQWNLFKSWVAENVEILYQKLKEEYIMYGEWLYAKHTIPYDNLPSYFLEYDVYHTGLQHFLSTPQREKLFLGSPIVSVHILAKGRFTSATEIIKLMGLSKYRINGPMEGLYIKVEEDDKVIGRYKYISKEFLDQILKSKQHWFSRQLEKNYVR